MIVVLLQPEELLGDIKGFLRSLGTLLHTNVRLKMDRQQRPMVYPYYGKDEGNLQDSMFTMNHRGKRELGKEVLGYVSWKCHPYHLKSCSSLTWRVFGCFRSEVYLEIDNRQCSQYSSECISSADQAAAYIAAEFLKSELPYPLHSITCTYTTRMHSVVTAKPNSLNKYYTENHNFVNHPAPS